MFQDSLQTLKMAKGKFKGSKEAVEQLKPDKQNHEVLVPLTGSMYVPGIMKNIESVVVDVGTGYYTEKDLPAAKDYFKRKVDFVQEQIEKIEVMGNEKSKIRDAIIDVMSIKIKQMQSQQQVAA